MRKLIKNNDLDIILLSITLLYCFSSGSASSLSLNDAIAEQLVLQGGTTCSGLIGTDNPNIILSGNLQALCLRTPPLNQPPQNPGGGAANTAPSSTGGGAATPTSVPRVLKKRLLTNENSDQSGGSAGQIVRLSSQISLFLSAEYQNLDRDVTPFEEGFNSDTWRVTAGTDFNISEQITAGLAFNYHHQEGDFAGGGGFEQNAYGGLFFASLSPADNLFIQIMGGYSYQDNERNRLVSFVDPSFPTVSGFVESDYNADEFSAGIHTGYDFSLSNFTIGPRLGLDWVRNNYESYSETGSSGLELRFAKDHRTSLQSRLGIFSSAALSTSYVVIVPQFGINWIHEFKNDQREIQFSFVDDLRQLPFSFQNEKPDRDFFEMSIGSSFVMTNGIQAFVNYRAILGHRYFDGHSANVGLNVAF